MPRFWTSIVGAGHMGMMLLRSNDLRANYTWLEHCRQHMFDESIGMDRAIVQGVWDRYPEVAPSVRQLEKLFEYDPPKEGEDLLDIGCGEGALSLFAVERFPELGSITALDLIERHVAKTNERLSALPQTLREKVAVFQHDATRPAGASAPALRERLARGFHKVYLVELTQDLTVPQFRQLFDLAYSQLHPGGLLSMVTLTTDRKPRGLREKIVFEMVVRSFAPTLKDIREVFAAYDCQVDDEDITDISSRKLGEYLLEHPDRVARAVAWPLSAVFNAAVKEGLRSLDTQAYSVRLFFVRKGRG